jgi:hypothetical protein
MLHCNMDEPQPANEPGGAQAWSAWRRWFDAWEGATARVLEQGLKNPWLLEPGGALLTGVMRLKSLSDRWVDAWWSAFGLATRREQERALHELNRLHSRLLDLEERREHGDPP